MLDSPNIFITIIAFLFMIGTLVIIHELGHYLVGRWCGVKAERFSIGFGPQIYGRVDKRGTLWRVAALPLGGYVQFAGDMGAAGGEDPEWLKLPEKERNQTFQSKKLWQRAAIVFAGPAVNFLFAILIIAGFYVIYGNPSTPAIIEQVEPDSAAQSMGLQKGDEITALNGITIDSFSKLVQEITIIPNENITLDIVRGNQEMEIAGKTGERIYTDEFGNQAKLGLLGVRPIDLVLEDVSIFEAPVLATVETGNIIRRTFITLGQIITGSRSVKDLGGPLKIAKISGEQFALGLLAYVSLIALISINLGFINLLPIPMLDGGHLLMYGIEAVRRKPVGPVFQEWFFKVGFITVIGFMVMVTFNDLSSFGLF